MKRTCSIAGCERPHDARGWCGTHYERWRKHGDPNVVLRLPKHSSEAARTASQREAKRRWRLANPEKMAAARAAWEAANPETRRRYRRERKKADPISNRAYVRARTARLRGQAVVAFTPEQLRQRLAYYGFRCWICGSPDDLTIDHVKPLSKGGAHTLANLRPACSTCNSKKGSRWPYEPHKPDVPPLHDRSS